jgi:hypothetical protein
VNKWTVIHDHKKMRPTLRPSVLIATACAFVVAGVALSAAGGAASVPSLDPSKVLECDERSLAANGEVTYVEAEFTYAADARSHETPESVLAQFVENHRLALPSGSQREIYRSDDRIDYVLSMPDGRITAVITLDNVDGWRIGRYSECSGEFVEASEDS